MCVCGLEKTIASLDRVEKIETAMIRLYENFGIYSENMCSRFMLLPG